MTQFPISSPSIVLSLSLFLLGASMQAAQAQRFDIHTIAPGDGYLVDRSDPWDDVPDEADALGKVAHAGSFFGNEYVTIVEFSLPPKTVYSPRSLHAAQLTLYTHQKGLSPADIEIFVYGGDNADGIVDAKDWSAGESLGLFLTEGESEISVLNKCPALDVTSAVQAALDKGAHFIGFRLRAKDVFQTRNRVEFEGVIFRLAEFGMQHTQYRPTLTLDFRE